MSELDNDIREGSKHIFQTAKVTFRSFFRKRKITAFGLGTRLAEKTNAFSGLTHKTPADYFRLCWDWFAAFAIGSISVLAIIIGVVFIILVGDFVLIELGYYGLRSRVTLALLIGGPATVFSVVYAFFLIRDNLFLYKKARIKKRGTIRT